MGNDLRGYTLMLHGTTGMVTETCYKCGVLFAMTSDYRQHRLNDHSQNFYCPNGHSQVYTGKTADQKLRDAEAREVALRDQLEASVVETERVRQTLMRDRQRFVNGVCPCCNRSFENVRRHMATKHPEYDADQVAQPLRFKCGCGRMFDSYRGLRSHQGWVRPDDWAKPGQPTWRSHLTVGA